MTKPLPSAFMLLALACFTASLAHTPAGAATAPFVVGSDGQTVILSNGDVYQFGGAPGWNYFNNIFTSAGRPADPDNVPVATDGHSVITSKGDWFEYSGHWAWNNNVFTSAGVPASPTDPVVGASLGAFPRVFTASGEWFSWGGPWIYSGNVFTGGPVPTSVQSWGAVKVKVR